MAAGKGGRPAPERNLLQRGRRAFTSRSVFENNFLDVCLAPTPVRRSVTDVMTLSDVHSVFVSGLLQSVQRPRDVICFLKVMTKRFLISDFPVINNIFLAPPRRCSYGQVVQGSSPSSPSNISV